MFGGMVRVVRDDVICCCRFSINTKGQIISLVNGNIKEINASVVFCFHSE